ncbi:MAG: inner membrane-spanning protein YciB [Formosimonas sp.]
MKFLIDLLPVVALFAVFKLSNDMLLATKAAVAASVLQMVFLKIKKLPIKAIHWFGFASIIVLGSLTVYLHDPFYLKLKFTIVEWVMAAAILIGQYGFKKNMLHALMGSELNLPLEAWNKLALRMALFFIFIGALNLAVMYLYQDNDNVWMNFKMFGTTALMFVFFAWQAKWLAPYLTENDPA